MKGVPAQTIQAAMPLPGQGLASQRQTSSLILGLFIFSVMALELQFFSDGLNLGVLFLIAVTGLVFIRKARFGHGMQNLTYGLHFHDFAYLAYVGYTIASAYWSVSPQETVIKAVPQLALWACTVMLWQEPVHKVVRFVLLFGLIAALLSLAMIPLSAELAYQPSSSTGSEELRGVFKHQLRLGAFEAAAAGLFLLAVLNGKASLVLFRNNYVNIIAFTVIFAVLVLSRTRLYFAVAIVSFGLTVLLSRRGLRKWIAGFGILVGAVLFAGIAEELLRQLEMTGFDTSLTGRTLIWTRTVGAIVDDVRLLGYGFGTFELEQFNSLFRGNYRPNHAHSSYLQAQFETGLVGYGMLLVLIASQIFASWRASVRLNRYSYSLFLVFYAVLGSLFGLNYAGSLSTLFCLMFLFLAIETRETRAVTVQVRPMVR